MGLSILVRYMYGRNLSGMRSTQLELAGEIETTLFEDVRTEVSEKKLFNIPERDNIDDVRKLTRPNEHCRASMRTAAS